MLADDGARSPRGRRHLWKRSGALVAALCLLVPAAGLAQAALLGTSGDDVLTGTGAADSIFALAGNDRLNGGAGDDDLDGGPGADDIRGGAGTDSVLYGGRSIAVAVTLDDVADDGQQGEADNVHRDVEQIYGGGGGDRLNGSARSELIDGADGDDSIFDGGGADRVYGGAGNDVLTTFDGARDVVDCGAGNDAATTDRSDLLFGCEKRLPAPRVRAPLTYAFLFDGPRTRFTRLIVRRLPAGGVVELRCRGRGCPFSATRVKVRPGQRRVQLTNFVRGRRLRVGAVLEVRVTAPQTIGRVERFVVRNARAPKHTVLCLPPATSTPKARC